MTRVAFFDRHAARFYGLLVERSNMVSLCWRQRHPASYRRTPLRRPSGYVDAFVRPDSNRQNCAHRRGPFLQCIASNGSTFGTGKYQARSAVEVAPLPPFYFVASGWRGPWRYAKNTPFCSSNSEPNRRINRTKRKSDFSLFWEFRYKKHPSLEKQRVFISRIDLWEEDSRSLVAKVNWEERLGETEEFISCQRRFEQRTGSAKP